MAGRVNSSITYRLPRRWAEWALPVSKRPRSFSGLFAIVLGFSLSSAAPAHAAAAATDATGDSRAAATAVATAHPAVDAATVVRRETAVIVDYFANNQSPSPSQTREFLDRAVAPHFDFDYMARWAVGPYLRRLSKEQLEKVAVHLQELFISGLARGVGMMGPNLPTVRVMPARRGRDAREQVVPAVARVQPGLSARLSFRCYWTGQAWKVFDVSLNGSSAVAYFRQYFAERLRRQGPAFLDNPT